MRARLAAFWRHLGRRGAPTLARDSAFRRGVWVVLFVLALAAIFASEALPSQVNFVVGQAASATIKAPHNFVDQAATARHRAEAAAAVAPVYKVDATLMQGALASFDDAVAAVNGARQATALTAAQRLAVLQPQLPGNIPSADQAAVLATSAETLVSVTADTRATLQAAERAGIRSDALDSARQTLSASVRRLPYPAQVDDFFARLASGVLVADDLLDATATSHARKAASAAVAPVTIVKGQVIVREGDVVTAADLTLLRDAGLLREGGGTNLLLGSLLTAGVLWALAWAFLWIHDREVLRRERALVLFGMIMVVAIGVERLLMPVQPFLVPSGAGTILYAVAFGGASAVFGAALLTAAAAILTHSVNVGLSVLVGSLAAAFGAGALHQRRDLIRAGLYAAGGGVAAVAALALFYGGANLARQTLLPDLAAAAGSGVVAGILAVGLLTYVEDLFGILTPVRLLELGNPNHTLLRRLVVEAPGTYHHSLMVGNLAEAAVQAVAGNPLLVRIGALYHDIGKLKRPYFFIENQFGGSNPHDHLSPNLSALVITSHVKDGVELAREQHLPQEIIDLIQTHHGTQLVSYFYERAKQESAGGEVLEANFRYDGPLPSTAEQAILMLADGVEAAVRAARTPSPAEIDAIVRRLVHDRLESGQLDRAPLTLRDIDTIAATFARVLQSAYHARIEYPEQVVEEFRRPRSREPELKRGAGA